MTQPTISITFSSIYQEVADYLGYGRSPTGDNLSEVKRYANDGYTDFLMGMDFRSGTAHRWSFMSPTAQITMWSSQTGDTASSLSGATDGAGNSATSIAGASAIFHASMVGHTVKFDSGNNFPIHSYTSGSTISVIGDATGETAGFSIPANGAYTFPDNFGYLEDDFRYGSSDAKVFMENRAPQNVRTRKAVSGTGDPHYFAVQPVSFSSVYGQRWEVLVHPTPGSVKTLNYRYAVNPSQMTGDNEYPLGGAMHGRTIRALALAAAEASRNDGQKEWLNRSQRLLAASIDTDMRTKPRNPAYTKL